jgi:hypothetical protein
VPLLPFIVIVIPVEPVRSIEVPSSFRSVAADIVPCHDAPITSPLINAAVVPPVPETSVVVVKVMVEPVFTQVVHEPHHRFLANSASSKSSNSDVPFGTHAGAVAVSVGVLTPIVFVYVLVAVWLFVFEGVCVKVDVAGTTPVSVCVAVKTEVLVCVAVRVEVKVLLDVCVKVKVEVGVCVRVLVGVFVYVLVGGKEPVGVSDAV